MQLQKISFKNIGPYGNKEQTLELPDSGGLWMVLGKNGHGKCHHKKTKLKISIENEELRNKFLDFLDSER